MRCKHCGSQETLDTWQPTPKTNKLIMSEWRLRQNGNRHNVAPGRDEIKKIQRHLKNNKADYEIMMAFGITAETLVSIKNNTYALESEAYRPRTQD